MLSSRSLATLSVAAFGIGVASCGSSGSGAGAPPTLVEDDAAAQSDPQLPPMGGANVEAWLAKGYFLQWRCETAAHAARPPSPHGVDLVCSNNVISGAGGAGPFPAGAAAVKQIFDAVGGKVIGHAVYRKLAADSAGGAGWYWYENDPRFTPAILGDGVGGSPGEMGACVGCHRAAGPDFAATARDFVYTQIQ